MSGVLPPPPHFGAIPYAGNPMGNGYGRIAEYVYRDLTSNTYNPAAELNVANVLDYHSNGGYGGYTQWREWNANTTGHTAGKGWWWGWGKSPVDDEYAIACEFARPVVLAGVELGIKFGEPSTTTTNTTIYAWVNDTWVAVSDSTQIDANLKIVFTHTFPRTTRMRIISDKPLWNVNSHPRIFIYK